MDVAVAQHRDVDGLFHFPDNAPVDARGIHLLPGPGMDSHQHRPRLLAGFGALHGRDVVGIPALAHLDRDGAGGVLHHLFHDPAADVRVQHQFAARAAGHDLGGRTAHVDVQEIELVLLNGRRGLPHDLGHLAKDLHAVGGPVGLRLEQADRFVVAIHQCPAGHHLADGKARAVLCHQAAAGGIREARHGAEHCLVGQRDIAKFQRFHCLPRISN